MSLVSVLGIFLHILELIGDVVCTILKGNTKLMDTIVKGIIYVLQQVMEIVLCSLNVLHIVLRDFWTFVLELSHVVVLLVQCSVSFVHSIFKYLTCIHSNVFTVIITTYSFTVSAFKNLLDCGVMVLEAVHQLVILVFSAIMLFLQSIPIFATHFSKLVILSFLHGVKYAMYFVWNNIIAIYQFLGKSLKKCRQVLQDIPPNTYIGILMLLVAYFVIKLAWMHFRLTGIPRCVAILPYRIFMFFRNINAKFHFYLWRLFSRILYNRNRGDLHQVVNIPAQNAGGSNSGDNQNIRRNSSKYTKVKKRRCLRRLATRDDDDDNDDDLVINRTLKAELEKERDRNLCVICQDQQRNIILLPCRHLCLCAVCYGKILALSNEECPICRHCIYDGMQVYV